MGYEQNYKVAEGDPDYLHGVFCDGVHKHLWKAKEKRHRRASHHVAKIRMRDDKNYCETESLQYEHLIERAWWLLLEW